MVVASSSAGSIPGQGLLGPAGVLTAPGYPAGGAAASASPPLGFSSTPSSSAVGCGPPTAANDASLGDFLPLRPPVAAPQPMVSLCSHQCRPPPLSWKPVSFPCGPSIAYCCCTYGALRCWCSTWAPSSRLQILLHVSPNHRSPRSSPSQQATVGGNYCIVSLLC